VTRRRLLRAAGAALGGLWLARAPRPAVAHAALVRSAPARRATVSASPARVRLWFSERVEARFSRVSVEDAGGRPVDRQDSQADPEDGKQLSVGLPPLGPGVYRVRYRVLSVDGHVVEGELSFTVRPAP
jgi:hypothetical protein